MTEKQIEQYLVKQVRHELKGVAYKFTSPGRRAVPDRLCIIPKYCFFVECKAPGKGLTEAQERERKRLLYDFDQWVYTVDSKYGVDSIINFWRTKLTQEGRLD